MSEHTLVPKRTGLGTGGEEGLGLGGVVGTNHSITGNAGATNVDAPGCNLVKYTRCRTITAISLEVFAEADSQQPIHSTLG